MNGTKTARVWLFKVALSGAIVLCSAPGMAAAPAHSETTKQAVKQDSAAGRKQARQLFAQAEEAFTRDEFDRALSLFQQAQEFSFNEAVNFNMAVCLERLNRVNEALDLYMRVQSSTSLNNSIKDRAFAAINRLQPASAVKQIEEPKQAPVPLFTPPMVSPATVVIALPPQKEPLPALRQWGWVGAGGAVLGLGAATTVWMLGKSNQRDYGNVRDLQEAQTLADRADIYDTALKLSWAFALTGLATVAVDRLWRD